eukprot:TRINITY_DN42238_c0_g1_i1.p1 TRINITY_DN42238_c0_g1~~TRINITY_DN42238_c0_g1_i1.p1  ORF type:complete len:141 (-),score=30.50 TRINITY_DN42238_c0_g1_i1:3-425(-)
MQEELYQQNKITSKLEDFPEEQPYQKAIENLERIEHLESPLYKLKVLLNIQDDILKCVQKFYQWHQNLIKNLSLELNQQEFMFIYMYIIAKSNVDLGPHIHFIEQFLQKQDLEETVDGERISFSMIKSYFEYIENMKYNN